MVNYACAPERTAAIRSGHGTPVSERFYRSDASRNRKYGGYGLGLAIASSIVAAHKGQLTVPALKGKMTGMSFRVPTADVSVVDLTAQLKKKTSYEEICEAVHAASEGALKGILTYTRDQIVSQDLVGNPHPSIFDETAGIMLDDDFVKLIAWYDNEWGYSSMVVRLLEHMAAVDQA